MTVRIALDAMGGDRAPADVVAGALLAVRELDVEVLLVGQPGAIRSELASESVPGLRIVEAPDVIGMDDHPTEAVRARPRASINVGLELVKKGEADAFVTAGNTGATMAAALLTLGRVPGIARPALGLVYASMDGKPAMFIDVGANADCRPIHLVQFALMGAAYMERMFSLAPATVALLSIGEEDSKGSQLVIETNEALRATRLRFLGNVESKDLLRGLANVIVTDGFTGNVVLKTVEGLSETLFSEVRRAAERTPWNRIAGLVLRPELRKVRRRLDYAEYGGVQLLGVDGVTVIAHGRSNARAIASAVRAAHGAVRQGVMDVVREVAREMPARRGIPSREASEGPELQG